MSEISAENLETTEKPEISNETNEEPLKIKEDIQDQADTSDSQQISSSSLQNDNENNNKTCSENQAIESEAQEITPQTANEITTCSENQAIESEAQEITPQTANEIKTCLEKQAIEHEAQEITTQTVNEIKTCLEKQAIEHEAQEITTQTVNEIKTCLVKQAIEHEAQEITPQTVNETKTCLGNQELELETHETTPQTANETEEAQNDNSSLNETADAKKCSDSSLEDTKSKCSANDSNREEKDTPSESQYAEHVTYTADGTAIYTDPKTNYKYKWCTKANNWIPYDNSNTSENPYENEHYKWCNETQKWIPKQQTQVTETEHYKWDSEKNEWVAKVKPNPIAEKINPKEIVYEIDDEGQRTYTDKDGTVFFWDEDKSAWFPKIDDDFMARYQMSYGFIDNTSASEKEKEKQELALAVEKEKELAEMVAEAKANEEASKDLNKQGLKRKGQQEPPKWFEIDPAHNTKVYVSNLPLDITLDEFAEVMGKCGMIMRDPQTQKYKIKLYTEADGQIKGDGLCDYIKVESVDLALKILDEYELRGHKLRVQQAQFQMRGEYNPTLKPKRKKKDKEKLAKIKEKLFDWRPEKMRGERSKHERTVIIKNLFHPDIFEKEVQLILDYQNDLRDECSKCGTVRKVVIYDRHSEGVAQINMSSPEEADLVIQMMQGRFFGKRQLTAEHWDGKTKYKIEETEEEIKKRLNKWDKYLETEESKKTELQQNEKEKDISESAQDE